MLSSAFVSGREANEEARLSHCPHVQLRHQPYWSLLSFWPASLARFSDLPNSWRFAKYVSASRMLHSRMGNLWSSVNSQLTLTITDMDGGEGMKRTPVLTAVGGSDIAHLLCMIKPAQPVTPQRSSCLFANTDSCCFRAAWSFSLPFLWSSDCVCWRRTAKVPSNLPQKMDESCS